MSNHIKNGEVKEKAKQKAGKLSGSEQQLLLKERYAQHLVNNE